MTRLLPALAAALALPLAFASPAPADTPPPLPTPTPAAAQPQIQYYASIGGEQAGPFSLEQMKQLIGEGKITRESLVWKSGLSDWRPGETFTEFAFPDGPPELDKSERFKAFMQGTWRFEFDQTVQNTVIRMTFDLTYRPDGTLIGTVTGTPLTMPGPPMTQRLSGTWQVDATGENTFILTVTTQGQGTVRATSSADEMEILGPNQLRNIKNGAIIKRIR